MTQTIDPSAVTIAIAMVEPRHAAVVHVVGRTEQLKTLLSEAFEATMQQVAASGAQIAGPPFARYLAFGDQVEAEAGFPYVGTLVPTERVHDAILPGGRAALTTHVGPTTRSPAPGSDSTHGSGSRDSRPHRRPGSATSLAPTILDNR